MHAYPPFSFLAATVRVLMADDNEALTESFVILAESYPLIEPVCALCAHSARTILEGPTPPHVCIYDLGLNDIEGDEFFLMRTCAQQCAFMVVTGRKCTRTAFSCANRGAVDFVAKPVRFSRPDFWSRLSTAFFWALLQVHDHTLSRPVSDAARVLIDHRPASITEWARRAGITEAYLRRIWSERYGVSPKIAQYLRSAYGYAFDYFHLLLQRDEAAAAEYLRETPHERLKEYWWGNQAGIRTLLYPFDRSTQTSAQQS